METVVALVKAALSPTTFLFRSSSATCVFVPTQIEDLGMPVTHIAQHLIFS